MSIQRSGMTEHDHHGERRRRNNWAVILLGAIFAIEILKVLGLWHVGH